LAEFNKAVIGHSIWEFALNMFLEIKKIEVFKAPEPVQEEEQTDRDYFTLDMVAGRLEGLPKRKGLVV